MATPQQVQQAIVKGLSSIAIPGQGGSFQGSLTVTGSNNFIKAPEVFVGEVNVKDLPLPENSVDQKFLADNIDLGRMS